MISKQYKGSQRCVLEWLSDGSFLSSMNELLKPTNANISANDIWLPTGLDNPNEGELKDFLKPHFSNEVGDSIKDWWLAVGHANARTPNWDLLSTATIEGKKGLILVEAKAHATELEGESKGKPLKKDASDNSKGNHTQIGYAIQEANMSINTHVQVSISRDKCYQLSNRVAHAWWLANQGIPVVLLYLGFLNAEDMAKDGYQTFNTDADWQTCFVNHAQMVGADKLLNNWIDCGKSKFITICKSL